MKIGRRRLLVLFIAAAVSFAGRAPIGADDRKRPPRFLPDERRIIEEYFRRDRRPSKGLPPGLAKRGGNLPPGLQKQLDTKGRLPPGLQKRLAPLPADLDRRLPRLPDYWERVILDRHVILMDRRTERILDIIEDVIDLVAGR